MPATLPALNFGAFPIAQAWYRLTERLRRRGRRNRWYQAKDDDGSTEAEHVEKWIICAAKPAPPTTSFRRAVRQGSVIDALKAA
jgi:hypothetical protein